MGSAACPNGRPDGPVGGHLRVLIVDDDADTSDSVAMLLGLWGFEAIAVGSGREALEAVQLHRPDVILLDLAMPKMNGLQVARRVREELPRNGHRPFIISISGHADTHTRRHSSEAGIDLHLAKPVNPADLEYLLRRFQSIVMPSAERR